MAHSSILITAVFLQVAAHDPDPSASRDSDIEQLNTQRPGAADLAVPNVTPAAKTANPTTVQQLPLTLDAPAEHGKGEDTLIRGDDRKTLTGEVARAAEWMRQRGQQPTPEALAREIGPDALATFLDQDPSALDSYGAPKGETAPQQGHEGPVIIVPPTTGN